MLWNNNISFTNTHLFSNSVFQILHFSLQPSRRRRLKKLLLFSSAMTWQRSSTAAWSEPAPRATPTSGPITILFVRLRVLAGQQTSGLGESALKCRCKVCSTTLLPGFWQMWVSTPFQNARNGNIFSSQEANRGCFDREVNKKGEYQLLHCIMFGNILFRILFSPPLPKEGKKHTFSATQSLVSTVLAASAPTCRRTKVAVFQTVPPSWPVSS